MTLAEIMVHGGLSCLEALDVASYRESASASYYTPAESSAVVCNMPSVPLGGGDNIALALDSGYMCSSANGTLQIWSVHDPSGKRMVRLPDYQARSDCMKAHFVQRRGVAVENFLVASCPRFVSIYRLPTLELAGPPLDIGRFTLSTVVILGESLLIGTQCGSILELELPRISCSKGSALNRQGSLIGGKPGWLSAFRAVLGLDALASLGRLVVVKNYRVLYRSQSIVSRVLGWGSGSSINSLVLGSEGVIVALDVSGVIRVLKIDSKPQPGTSTSMYLSDYVDPSLTLSYGMPSAVNQFVSCRWTSHGALCTISRDGYLAVLARSRISGRLETGGISRLVIRESQDPLEIHSAVWLSDDIAVFLDSRGNLYSARTPYLGVLRCIIGRRCGLSSNSRQSASGMPASLNEPVSFAGPDQRDGTVVCTLLRSYGCVSNVSLSEVANGNATTHSLVEDISGIGNLKTAVVSVTSPEQVSLSLVSSVSTADAVYDSLASGNAGSIKRLFDQQGPEWGSAILFALLFSCGALRANSNPGGVTAKATFDGAWATAGASAQAGAGRTRLQGMKSVSAALSGLEHALFNKDACLFLGSTYNSSGGLRNWPNTPKSAASFGHDHSLNSAAKEHAITGRILVELAVSPRVKGLVLATCLLLSRQLAGNAERAHCHSQTDKSIELLLAQFKRVLLQHSQLFTDVDDGAIASAVVTRLSEIIGVVYDICRINTDVRKRVDLRDRHSFDAARIIQRNSTCISDITAVLDRCYSSRRQWSTLFPSLHRFVEFGYTP